MHCFKGIVFVSVPISTLAAASLRSGYGPEWYSRTRRDLTGNGEHKLQARSDHPLPKDSSSPAPELESTGWRSVRPTPRPSGQSAPPPNRTPEPAQRALPMPHSNRLDYARQMLQKLSLIIALPVHERAKALQDPANKAMIGEMSKDMQDEGPITLEDRAKALSVPDSTWRSIAASMNADVRAKEEREAERRREIKRWVEAERKRVKDEAEKKEAAEAKRLKNRKKAARKKKRKGSVKTEGESSTTTGESGGHVYSEEEVAADTLIKMSALRISEPRPRV